MDAKGTAPLATDDEAGDVREEVQDAETSAPEPPGQSAVLAQAGHALRYVPERLPRGTRVLTVGPDEVKAFRDAERQDELSSWPIASDTFLFEVGPQKPVVAQKKVGGDVPESMEDIANNISKEVLKIVGRAAQTMPKRLASTFSVYLLMLVVVFLVGIVAVAAALVKGFSAESAADAATTAAFAGLSAVSFITVFVTNPLRAMSSAGPQSAWVLAMVTTFWAKFAYFKNQENAIIEIQAAQEALDKSFETYFANTQATISDPEPEAPATESDTPAAGSPGNPPTFGSTPGKATT
ncbi:hypothetical protein [Cellulosimicrobium sp. Marseille-Q4280]|uniref:hypothetical protein n=1 Tax=Cellulosimicrobium sp. Marseille-Q4280 TaxID=2937992 RepID=UPI00203C5DD0|nr:hypothetical protein [Cellulosimicrobium sp. Marseille-Q4280]